MAVERQDAAQGTVVTLRANFRQGGVLVDPYEVRQVLILDASLNVLDTISTVTHDGVGRYSVTWSIPTDATVAVHHDRWFSTYESGGTESQFTLNFYVAPEGAAALTRYISIEAAKTFLPEGNTLTDSEIDEMILLAMETIERITDQKFVPVSESRTFDGTGENYLNVRTPIRSLSKIEILDCDGSVVGEGSVGYVRITPSRTLLMHAREQGFPRYRTAANACMFPSGIQNIRVTGEWGRYAEPPRLIKHATGLLVGYMGSEDEPTGTPGTPFVSENAPGDRSYQLRRIWQNKPLESLGTGFPDVDSILARFRAAGTISVI